ncbi:PQQ-binding-like beta-propeller repeat protein [Skermania piniformis]|uniref:PQQ-binding-like beta-propeller repeat protein n=1 Tax=Skermania pinensis TaxID=39122 RepID=A0ABX8S5P6_9ACTN|nr:PQQ-binding-like beta-propeller repeat protein [Skermania piniformis]QXQ12776.1 PQQ-binding-like beta-propeller repeat protein [Skermania piniformis]
MGSLRAARRHRHRWSGPAILLFAGVLSATGCSADGPDPTGPGWPSTHGDPRNSSTSPVSGTRSPQEIWSRPLGAPTAGGIPIAPNGQLFVGADTVGGCNYFAFELATGRKRFCNRVGAGVVGAGGTVDTANNVYVGDDGAMNSFNEHGQARWRTPVMGTPLASTFTADGNLLFVTHLGQINVLDPQTGQLVLPAEDVLGTADFLNTPDLPWPANDQGLADCGSGGPACPVATAPALDVTTGRFYVAVRPPDSADAAVTAIGYADGKLVRDWTVPVLTGGTATAPALSADGRTLYLTDRAEHLLAIETGSGAVKWQQDLGYQPNGGLVVQDGLIIPPGGTDGHLVAFRDRGDHAELAWTRDDLTPLGSAAAAAGDIGYVVVAGASGDGDLRLITFDTAAGTTIDEDPMPGARGPAVGVSLGPAGEVLATTVIGEVFAYRSGS